jgi:hypothetical protein
VAVKGKSAQRAHDPIRLVPVLIRTQESHGNGSAVPCTSDHPRDPGQGRIRNKFTNNVDEKDWP